MDIPRSAPTDRELVERFRDAGSDAFTVLYRRHARVVYSFAARILNQSSDVEDVVQDTFVLAWHKLDARRIAGESVLPWLLSTTRFLAFNRNRALVRLRPLDEESLDVASPDLVEKRLLDLEESEQLATALKSLSDLDRRIVRLCLGRGLSYKQAARQVGVTHASIRNRLSRARRTLKLELHILKGGEL